MIRSERQSYRRLAAIWLASLILLISTQQLAAATFQEPTRPQGAAPATASKKLPAYARGQLIVKYKNSVTECVHCLLKDKKPFKHATTDQSDSLDRLHAKHHVRAAKALFRSEADELMIPGRGPKPLQSIREYEERRRATIRATFRERSRRSPDGYPAPELAHVYQLDLPEEADIEAIAAEFSADPHVEYAQPNFLVAADFVPNDPYYSSRGALSPLFDDLWGLKRIQMAQAWDIHQGAGVTLAVVDTGIAFGHPDLALNIWTNPRESVNGRDDDGNGFIDDIRGWNFVTGTNDPTDDNGHGTMVSGIAAAVGNNGMGIIGVAPQAKILVAKFMDSNGVGSVGNGAAAIRYVADLGADVINNSWGCRCPSNPVAEDALRYARSLGAVVVFAAGNSNEDVMLWSPQNMDESLTVAAFDPNDRKAGFSNYGAAIDVAAPGTDILSTSPPDWYAVGGGTSFAAAYAAGLAALVVAKYPDFSVDKVQRVLRSTADDVDLPGPDVNSGAGRINAARALTSPNRPPSLAILAPDINNDGIVNSTDLMFVAQVFGTANLTRDLDGNGTVNSTDLDLCAQAFGLRWPPSNLAEGRRLVLYVKGTDPDGDPLTYTASQLPSGATFTQMGSGANVRGQFIWTPTYAQAGTYTVTMTASDGYLSASQSLPITVMDAPLVIVSLAATPNPFSPNGDGVSDTTTISATFTHQANWVLNIALNGSTIIQRFTGSNSTSVTQVWDGKNIGGTLQPAGAYTYYLQATDGGPPVTKTGTVTLQ